MKKARDYLPYRLEYYAKLYGYHYERCRLSHAATRWGSCSSSGTISLNIGLMQVPEILRDYVIIHELAHLNHMDHSAAFWAEVAEHDPRYKEHRHKLKNFSPASSPRKTAEPKILDGSFISYKSVKTIFNSQHPQLINKTHLCLIDKFRRFCCLERSCF